MDCGYLCKSKGLNLLLRHAIFFVQADEGETEVGHVCAAEVGCRRMPMSGFPCNNVHKCYSESGP